MAVSTPVSQGGHALNILRPGAAQNVGCNAAGGSSTQSNAFGKTTEAIMIAGVANDARIAIGPNPTATSSSMLLPKPFLVVFGCNPGDKIAAISNDANTGSITVTEVFGIGP